MPGLLRMTSLSALALLLGTHCSSPTVAAEPTATTPDALFRSILVLSKEQRYDELRVFVLPIREERMKDAGYRDSRDLAIYMIKTETYPSNGDFAYSNAGLKVLIERHLDKFNVMSAKYHESMREYPYDSNSDVQEALQNDPDGFLLMAYMVVNVVIVRVRGSYRLLFWEHLPRLAGGRRQQE